MKPEKTSYRPIRFVDRIEGNTHIVLLGRRPKSMQTLSYLDIFQMVLKNGSHVFSLLQVQTRQILLKKDSLFKALTLTYTSREILCAFIILKDLMRIIKSMYLYS